MSAEASNPFGSFARLYDWEHDPFDEDVALYLALAGRFGGPVLELACGTGRLLAPLAAAGLACTGLDSAPAMLARAHARLEAQGLSATFEQQPMESFALAGRFRTILLPLDGLALLLTHDAQIAALTRARQHATHDARLVLDVSNGNLRGGAEPPEEFLHHLTAPDPESGLPITKWVIRRPHPDQQLDQLTFLYDETDRATGFLRRTSVDLTLRWFTCNEVLLLLRLSGWQADELYGSYDLEPYGPTSDRLIVVARPAPLP